MHFHSLRHSCGTLLAAAGVYPKVNQRIIRHSTITLTMDRYTHLFKGDEADALRKLPDLSTPPAEQACATGTDDRFARVDATPPDGERQRERAPHISMHQAAPSGADSANGPSNDSLNNSDETRDLALCSTQTPNADSWTRTSNLGLMNPSL